MIIHPAELREVHSDHALLEPVALAPNHRQLAVILASRFCWSRDKKRLIVVLRTRQ